MAIPAGPYTPAVRAGDFLYLSGQIGFDDANDLVEGFNAQARQSIANLFALLQANGASKANLVKTVCFVTDADNLATMNEIYAELFGDTLPARSTIVVAALPKGAIFEIEGIAYVGG
jgi:2-iminobutanoate/2-iminopropanoate deaminase